MTALLPDIGSLWHYPPWTNPKWSGPWKVVSVGPPGDQAEFVGEAVALERVDGPPESAAEGTPHEYPLAHWPGRWEPWDPEVPDFPPAA